MMEYDYLQLIKEAKAIKDNSTRLKAAKIAVVGDNSTQQYVQVLKALLYRNNVYAEIYESEYDVIEQEIYDEKSGLYGFKPDYVLIHTSTQKLRDRYYQYGRTAEKRFADATIDLVTHWWEKLSEKTNARIIQNLFALPLERTFGNYSSMVDDFFYAQIKRINAELIKLAKGNPDVYLNDIEHVSSLIGRRQWFDEKLWVHAKLFCPPDYFPYVAENVVMIVLAGFGKTKKCIVFDLDDTVWGGIIGEDGLENIAIGREGLGEAFLLFQRYLLDMKKRGILLAVCSKNDIENAQLPFLKHPEMALKLEDISEFVANWDNKADNIRKIAQTLNIGLDSIVFIDDSSFERNQVRGMLPEVCVPEMPEDAAEYGTYLNSLNLFETLAYSEEDAKRAQYYQEQASRDKVKAKFTNINDYLSSLNMQAEFKRFDQMHLPRIAQLIGRSNQFNLTTKRYSQKECEDLMNDKDNVCPFYVTLKDKFGDNGLISVIILKKEGETLVVDEWLMSCRVLMRGVEQFAMNRVVECAASLGCSVIEGLYIPTAKNHMVKDFYAGFGFKKAKENKDKSVVWHLDVTKYKPCDTKITSTAEETVSS